MTLLSIAAAAREAGDRPAIITRERTWTFAECAETIEHEHEHEYEYEIARPEAATVLAMWSALEHRRPLALVHPQQPREVPPLPADAALVLFTSGSTGAPRGVVHTRASLEAAARAHAWRWQADDRWLLCLPLAHAGGAAIALRCLAARRPIVLHEGDFDARAVATLATAARATLASFVPTQLAALLDLPTLPAFRAVLLGGAPATPDLVTRARTRGIPAHATYGLTETFGQIATARAPGEPLVALPGVELVAGTREAPARICIRAPMLAARYLDGAAIAPELVTGDLGYLADGMLHVAGRADDMIITGGENVFPAEVEAVLAATPGVRAACAFGVRDPRWGELVAAALAIDEVAFDRRAALARWHSALPPHARPRRLVVRAELPLLPSGKLDRRAAAALATEPVEYAA